MSVRTYKILKSALCLIIAFASVFVIMSVSASAEETYISDITLAEGTDASGKLVKDGYTVLFQGMNVASDESSTVLLGYKKGTEPITGIIVSSNNSGTLKAGNVIYTLASDIDLNKGTDGTPVYLYYTKDKSAGSGITSLDTVSGLTDKDDVIPLKNDGSSPVRTDKGKLANLDAGISGSELYLLMYRGGSVEQYISDAGVVSAKSEKAAVKAAADSGFDYYVDCDLDKSESVSYVAYNRTSSKDDAITSLTLSGTEITTEKNKDSGTYLLDISGSELFAGSFRLGDWIKYYSYTNGANSKSSPVYTSLLGNEDECNCVPADNSGKIYLCYLGKAEAVTGVTETTTITEESTEETVPETDEYLGINKNEDDSTSAEAPDGTEGSAIGNGNIIAVICSAVLIILVSAGLAIYKSKKGRKKNEKN